MLNYAALVLFCGFLGKSKGCLVVSSPNHFGLGLGYETTINHIKGLQFGILRSSFEPKRNN